MNGLLNSYDSYPTRKSWRATVSVYLRRHSKACLVTFIFLAFVGLLSSNHLHDQTVSMWSTSTTSKHHGLLAYTQEGYFINFGGAAKAGYFRPEESMLDADTFHFAAISDLDQLSRLSGKKLKFHSILIPGTLKRHGSKYSISFEPERELIGGHNEAGRGMELSELTLFQNRLFSFDDRTGSVFELLSKDGGDKTIVTPRFVITEGDGETDKGMKWEWATVKGSDLYIGSMGKEYTNSDGSIANTNNLWIAVISEHGEVSHIDWNKEYMFVRKVLGASPPGYVIHEAVLWSEYLQKWLFLPRRVSTEAYDEVVDEKKGSNKLVVVDENFTDAKVVNIKMKEVNPLHGFSSFAFVPGTKDRHAMALRSVEDNCVGGDEDLCKQSTFAIVFDVLSGEVLMDEQELPVNYKFEGLEFVKIHTPDPTRRRR